MKMGTTKTCPHCGKGIKISLFGWLFRRMHSENHAGKMLPPPVMACPHCHGESCFSEKHLHVYGIIILIMMILPPLLSFFSDEIFTANIDEWRVFIAFFMFALGLPLSKMIHILIADLTVHDMMDHDE